MIESLNNFLGVVVFALILIVLCINTIRDIIKLLGWIPDNKKLEKWIYNFASEEQLKNIVNITLDEVGIKDKKRESLRNLNNNFIVGDIDIDNSKWLQNLIILLSKHIQRTDETMLYGNETPIKTRYYVNTMDASLDEQDNSLMCQLAWQLIINNYKQYPAPDFIVTPKMGNPAFSIGFARKYNIICLLRKANDDNSRVKSEKKETTHSLVNLEGAYQLKLLADKHEKKLYGAVFDCNCSGGSSLLKTAVEFNQTIADNNLNINPINSAYVLFRPDNDIDIDEKFRQQQIKIIRYFDLTEEIKESLYKLGSKIKENNNEIYSKDITQCVATIVADLTKKKLIKRLK